MAGDGGGSRAARHAKPRQWPVFARRKGATPPATQLVQWWSRAYEHAIREPPVPFAQRREPRPAMRPRRVRGLGTKVITAFTVSLTWPTLFSRTPTRATTRSMHR